MLAWTFTPRRIICYGGGGGGGGGAVAAPSPTANHKSFKSLTLLDHMVSASLSTRYQKETWNKLLSRICAKLCKS